MLSEIKGNLKTKQRKYRHTFNNHKDYGLPDLKAMEEQKENKQT